MIKLEDLSKKFNLQDHDLLDKIAESLNQKIIGETNNKKIIFLVCLTKDLQRDERLSLIISSVSSAGKSNLLNNVLEIFKKDVIDFTEFTQSYYQRQMSNLNGKNKSKRTSDHIEFETSTVRRKNKNWFI